MNTRNNFFILFQEEDKEAYRKALEDNVISLFDTAPTLLKEILSVATTVDQKLMAAPALITIAGVCFSNCTVRYDEAIEHPCLYQAAVAPAGSGKSIIPLLGKLLDPINEEFEKENTFKRRMFKSALAAFKSGKTKSAKPSNPEQPLMEPEEPLMKSVKIAGDSSSGKLAKQLSNNQGMIGITIVSEADSIGLAGNQSYANQNSTIMRAVYENEDYDVGRLYDGGSFIVKNPKYSMIVAGTRDQFQNIFRSATNGLYSRFLISSVKGSSTWKSVKPCYECVPATDKIKGFSEEFYQMYKEGSKLDIRVRLTDAQWQTLDDFGNQTLSLASNLINKDATALPKRHAVMVARMTLILTMVRYIGEGQQVQEAICSDDDFNIAMAIAQLSLYNSFEVFKTLPSHKVDLTVQKKISFLKSLPANFNSAAATAIAEGLNISKTSRKRYIDDFIVGGLIVRPFRDNYEKTPMGLMDLGSSDLSDSDQRSKGPKAHGAISTTV